MLPYFNLWSDLVHVNLNLAGTLFSSLVLPQLQKKIESRRKVFLEIVKEYWRENSIKKAIGSFLEKLDGDSMWQLLVGCPQRWSMVQYASAVQLDAWTTLLIGKEKK